MGTKKAESQADHAGWCSESLDKTHKRSKQVAQKVLNNTCGKFLEHEYADAALCDSFKCGISFLIDQYSFLLSPSRLWTGMAFRLIKVTRISSHLYNAMLRRVFHVFIPI